MTIELVLKIILFKRGTEIISSRISTKASFDGGT